MEDSSQNVLKDFEQILRNTAKRATLGLYRGRNNTNTRRLESEKSCTARDVITNVNKQIEALQRADKVIPCKHDRDKLIKCKKSSLLSVNMLPREVEVPKNKTASRFETQCVSDTQLMDFMDKAEAIANSNNGITQEFDHSFCGIEHSDEGNKDKHTSTDSNTVQMKSLRINDEKDSDNTSEQREVISNLVEDNATTDNSQNVECNHIEKDNLNKFTETDCFGQTDNTNFNENSTEVIVQNNKAGPSYSNTNEKIHREMIDDDIITPSPIFQVRKSKSPSPLVFDLGSFENFEKIALPIIKEDLDLSKMKTLINSQIIGRELQIGTNMKAMNTIVDKQTSPILKMSTEKIKLTKTQPNVDLNSHNNNDMIAINTENNATFLKDEILFSSDEEEEHIQKELEDIPLTCALETSFYDQPHVLDKTMYVGFQTASNRSIQITTDSFIKAKSLLDEIDIGVATSTSLTGLVDHLSSKYDNLSHSCNTQEMPKCTDARLEHQNNNIVSDEKHNVNSLMKNENTVSLEKETGTRQRPDKRKFDGFMTASKKMIKLSEAALVRCKEIFQDIDLEEDFEVSSKINAEYRDKKSETVQSHLDDDILQEFSHDMSLVDEQKKETADFIGFKTANQKEIRISEAALARTKKLFEDIDDGDDCYKDFSKPSTSKDVCGFTRASRKDKISGAALTKSKQIFQDIISNETEHEIGHSVDKDFNTFVAFDNINSKQIKQSKEAVLKTKPTQDKCVAYSKDTKAFNEEICQDLSEVFENETLDFETEKALLNNSQNQNVDIQLVDNNKVSVKCNPVILKESQTKCGLVDDTKLSENKTINILTSHRDISSISFKTANNKPINISKHALEKSKKLFDDVKIDDINVVDKEPIPFRGFKTVCKPMPENKTLLKDVDKNYIGDDMDMNSVRFQGFQLASKKPIAINYDALAKSKALFKDIDNEYSISKRNTENVDQNLSKVSTGFKGFQTADNKPISVSADALAKSKALFENLDSDFDNICKPSEDVSFKHYINVPTFKGFQTANNKPINVSAEALAKSKSVFKDLDCKDISGFANSALNTKVTLGVFQTASNKKINVSSEALVQSKLLFKDDNNGVEYKRNHESTRNDCMFKGFQTANNKPVSVSSEALAKSKVMFNDIEKNTCENINTEIVKSMPKFKGFKTGNQKDIKISADALAKSKAVFSDIDKENSVNCGLSKYRGFQTASNKSVKISEEAIEKVKNIFNDIDGLKENEMSLNQFRGFQTASSKKVEISDQALKKARHIFQDINPSENKVVNDIIEESCNVEKDIKKSQTFRIKTAKSGGNVIKKSLNDTKLKLIDTQAHNNKIEEKSKSGIPSKDSNIEKLIDTQIINDFEVTLHTEDFCKNTTPKQSKRSGSPILSCPKAKKRKKFETPYRNDGKNSFINELITVNSNKLENIMIFNKDYKKNKRFKLKDLSKVEERSKIDRSRIDPYVLEFDLDNFLKFEFTGKRNDITDGKLTTEHLKDIFQKSVDKKLIPIGWAENHLKLIIWKLISYEIKFPTTLAFVCKAKNVLEQLKYRFDKELYNAERPALRKIFEKDDVASKTIVLCVAGIYVDGMNVKSVTNNTSNVELLMTDGWYFIKACIDKMLVKLLFDDKITVGCKIVTTGAELVNCEQGVSPWEDTSSVRLKIYGNSTRRARWDARLGYHGNGAILSRLSSVKPEGGKVSKLRLFVTRAYPMLYVEKFEDGSTVTRSERLEHIHQAKYETDRQTAMEKLYEEVEKEVSDQESQDSLGSQGVGRKALSDTSITESQVKSLEDRSKRKRDRLLQNMEERVRKKMQERGLSVGRNVVVLWKVRVAGVDAKDGNAVVTKGLMSIWRPNDLLTEIIREGAWIEVTNVVPTAVRYSEIQISAGRQSTFSQYQKQVDELTNTCTQSLKRICYPLKDLAQNPTMTTDYNEVDTIGLIFHVDQESNQPFQNVYLTDSEKNIICINFWGGLKKFGFQNILEVGQIVYGTNLQKRAGNTRKCIPHFRVTEFSYFTKTPKNAVARTLIGDLEMKLSGLDKRKYCIECVVLKNNYSSKYVTDMSPYRLNNDHNLSKNKPFIDSPLAAKSEDNFNLTGLDFESTFKQLDSQELSPKTLQRKKLVRQKIAKLKMIGEPPPLCPLNIINKSNSALNSYKSPLAQNSVANMKSYQSSSTGHQSNPIIQTDANISHNCNRTIEEIQSSPLITMKRLHQKDNVEIHSSPLLQNVTSKKKTYQNSRIVSDDIQSSPIFSMNRTYVKNVNPVKLNFSKPQDNSTDDIGDQFGEDFDGSPPLSFD